MPEVFWLYLVLFPTQILHPSNVLGTSFHHFGCLTERKKEPIFFILLTRTQELNPQCYLFTFSSFYDPTGNSNYTSPNDQMPVINKLKRIRIEVVMTQFKEPLWYLPVGREGKWEKPQSVQLVSCLRFELATLRTQVRRIGTSANLLGEYVTLKTMIKE